MKQDHLRNLWDVLPQKAVQVGTAEEAADVEGVMTAVVLTAEAAEMVTVHLIHITYPQDGE